MELIAADYRSQRFSAHWHAGFAIGVVTRNAQQLSTWGRRWTAGRGDLILLNPGQVHDGSPLQPDGWSSRMAYVPRATMAAIVHAKTGLALSDLSFTCPIVRSARLAEMFEDWHVRAELGHDDFLGPSTIDVIGAVASRVLSGRSRIATDTRCVRAAVERCERLLCLSQDGDSAEVGFEGHDGLRPGPRTSVWRQAHSRFGVGPQALKRHLRLVWTKQRLAQGVPIIDAALAAGYHDQSHFTRQFVAAYGMTPAQFSAVQRTYAGAAGPKSSASSRAGRHA